VLELGGTDVRTRCEDCRILLAEAAMDTGKYIQAFQNMALKDLAPPLLRLPESVMNQSEYIMVFALLMW